MVSQKSTKTYSRAVTCDIVVVDTSMHSGFIAPYSDNYEILQTISAET